MPPLGGSSPPRLDPELDMAKLWQTETAETKITRELSVRD